MLCFKHDAHREPTINLSNVQPNERFNYSIVLIRGEIVNYNHRSKTTLQITNPSNEKSCIEHAEIRSDGKFCVAIDLHTGMNSLTFQYCCASHEIPLIFAPHENPTYLLKVLYIICQNHSGCFQAPDAVDNSVETACGKIDLAIRMVQCMFAEMLAKHGLHRKSFAFVKCEPFFSGLTVEQARQWNQNELWKYHAMEMLAHGFETQQQQYKFFGILASTVCEKGIAKGNVALGIGDVALFGSGTLYAWPERFPSIQMCFRDETAVDTNQLMDDSNGRRTFGGCYATALGSMCHEIGHIFDLGHTENGIMGCDIDYVQRMFIIEKCPRELPRRMSSKCSQQSDAFYRPTDSGDRRLTAVKKINSILSNYHSRRNDDLTFLSENCAILLNYHKWFNQLAPDASRESDIRYESDRKMIASSIPLAFVEFRSATDGMCLKYYRFDVSNEHQFTIPANINNDNNCDVIALDKCGNILRFNSKAIG